MARTNVAAQMTMGAYPTLPLGAGAADLTWVPADTVNLNSTVITDTKTMLFVHNTDTAAHHVTIHSAPDTFNRTGDITTYAVNPDAVSMFGPFKVAGWANSTLLNIDGDHVDIMLAVVQLP